MYTYSIEELVNLSEEEVFAIKLSNNVCLKHTRYTIPQIQITFNEFLETLYSKKLLERYSAHETPFQNCVRFTVDATFIYSDGFSRTLQSSVPRTHGGIKATFDDFILSYQQ